MFIKPVICSKCKKNLATIKITRIVSNQVQDIHLCQDCAAETSPYQKKISEYQKDLSEIISGLLKQQKAPSDALEIPGEAIDLTCENCGFPFESYRKSFFLGCSHCYKVFSKHLINDIRKIHGSVQHTGRVPQRYQKVIEIKRTLENLKRDLQEAVRSQNFERAATLRDQIRDINPEGSEE